MQLNCALLQFIVLVCMMFALKVSLNLKATLDTYLSHRSNYQTWVKCERNYFFRHVSQHHLVCFSFDNIMSSQPVQQMELSHPAQTDSVAAISGLHENHSESIGNSWHPFGKHDEHQDAAKNAEKDEEKQTVKEHDAKDQKVGGSLSDLVSGFKKLGSKIRGDKSHRFSDLLHLHKEVKRDLSDVTLYPELEKDAELRRNNELSGEEKIFLQSRKEFIASSGVLHRFLFLQEDEKVHPDDVPIVALGGSGGGYRACLGFLAYIEEMQNKDQSGAAGLWDLCAYVAGVSGSCWTIGGLYSVANMNATFLIDRFSKSSTHHPLSMTAIDSVARSANGIYFQLAPILQKIRVGHIHPGPLDLYGTLITSHIFFEPPVLKDAKDQKGPHVALQRDWFRFSLSHKTNKLQQGLQPLPILTAVRHERPWRDWKSPEEAFSHSNHESAEHKDVHAWWQWFEFSSIEFGCDELEGWIPIWSFGRHFEEGKNTQRLPERSLSLILGICTSAPAGPLAAWLATLYRNLPKGFFGTKIKNAADEWVEKHPEEAERLQSHHPIHSQNEPNPFFHAEKQENRGQGFENSPRIHLVDAGMSNNLPQHSFFRPGRDVDLMLLGDFSSDVQSGAALERIQEFGAAKGVTIHPREHLDDLPPWPQELIDSKQEGKEDAKTRNKSLTADEIQARFKGRYAQILDVKVIPEAERTKEQGPTHIDEAGIRYNARHQPQATRDTTMIYMPLLPHACQPDYDPSTAAFSSSYNLVWTEEQVGIIRKTSRANVVEGIETIRKAVREIYESKKAARLSATVKAEE